MTTDFAAQADDGSGNELLRSIAEMDQLRAFEDDYYNSAKKRAAQRHPSAGNVVPQTSEASVPEAVRQANSARPLGYSALKPPA